MVVIAGGDGLRRDAAEKQKQGGRKGRTNDFGHRENPLEKFNATLPNVWMVNCVFTHIAAPLRLENLRGWERPHLASGSPFRRSRRKVR
jgi:hypothetical protein